MKHKLQVIKIQLRVDFLKITFELFFSIILNL